MKRAVQVFASPIPMFIMVWVLLFTFWCAPCPKRADCELYHLSSSVHNYEYHQIGNLLI
ncbi:MAG: hypothetical protein MUF42_00070 [Cytophagaceae bacterium]|nr:hypothetical protein [Cytophagaceae bacterium]